MTHRDGGAVWCESVGLVKWPPGGRPVRDPRTSPPGTWATATAYPRTPHRADLTGHDSCTGRGDRHRLRRRPDRPARDPAANRGHRGREGDHGGGGLTRVPGSISSLPVDPVALPLGLGCGQLLPRTLAGVAERRARGGSVSNIDSVIPGWLAVAPARQPRGVAVGPERAAGRGSRCAARVAVDDRARGCWPALTR